jgi:erythromycin esterase
MTGSVTGWIEATARPLSAEDGAPLDDVRPVAAGLADATVVALGVSARITHELSVVAARFARVLVADHGFRSFVLEGDERASAELDAYVRTGAGDPAALLGRARTFWRSREILDLVRWLRAWNAQHPDDLVRIVHPGDGAVPTTQLDEAPAVERALAADVLDWHRRAGGRIVYWGGLAHTTPREVDGQPSAGALLRRRFGRGYAHVGLTLGAVAGGAVPRPEPGFVEAVLSAAGPPVYALALRATVPEPVRAWLTAPALVRVVGPRYDPAVRLEGGSLTDWFDVLVHARDTTPLHLLADAPSPTPPDGLDVTAPRVPAGPSPGSPPPAPHRR